MLMVISPAKRVDFDSSVANSRQTIPEHLEQAQILIDLLREKDSFDIAELMKLSMNLADLNVARYQVWRSDSSGKQALWAFRGDVYRSMDADTFSNDDLLFCQQHLRILSGLYGLLRPLDTIQPYRLEMGTKLVNSRGANLYDFWGGLITQGVNDALKQNDDSILINLASKEYFRSIKPDQIDGTVITPVFKECKNGGYKVIGVYAKRARGLMARYIIQNRLRHPDELQSFDVNGYRWNETLSDASQMVFSRA